LQEEGRVKSERLKIVVCSSMVLAQWFDDSQTILIAGSASGLAKNFRGLV